MSEPTPGPWAINGNAIESEDMILAHVYDPDDNGPDEWQSNARLIAAAPDLLLACELVKGWMELENIKPGPVVWIELCRAIALAKEERR